MIGAGPPAIIDASLLRACGTAARRSGINDVRTTGSADCRSLYHSIVVPTVAAITALRSSALCRASDSEAIAIVVIAHSSQAHRPMLRFARALRAKMPKERSTPLDRVFGEDLLDP